ncbi:hypothetical protein JYU34_018759 [Plutella xylostella]|uniref:Protein FAM161A n=1 Tax=Plutella xylostella TaxID=51655 RepID=A0ABQ7PYF0_PLUXY|nr:hypothetical protein JYU34_018759 [Plutella xylostella]
MAHSFSVFANSCVKVPVDPVTKMPKTSHDRKEKTLVGASSIDSESTTRYSLSPTDMEADKLKEFYRSIPDYNEIDHLPPEEFYSTLKLLREKKKLMLERTIDNVTDIHRPEHIHLESILYRREEGILPSVANKKVKTKFNQNQRRKYSADKIEIKKTSLAGEKNNESEKIPSINSVSGTCMKRETRNSNMNDDKENDFRLISPKKNDVIDKNITKNESKPRRNHSACSISWNDNKVDRRDEIDVKFNQYFDGKNYASRKKHFDDEFKIRSMPSSPLRHMRSGSPLRRRKSITIPKAFKMTERDEEDRIVNELRCIRKSLSDDMLHRKRDRKCFRARPVPIESRIPLYDKILEDQAMRRAITKINSEAELRAQMKPFNFTKREEKGLQVQPGVCQRAVQTAPKAKRKKRFRARPVPKNLFSNYVYDKMKEDEYFRSFNRRIRAEEMLRTASLPGSMATRDRSRLSTPAAHSDLPSDPSPPCPSPPVFSSDRQRAKSPTKEWKRREKKEFITTSPQPFHLNTAERAAKKMEDIKKIYQESKYQESKSTPSVGDSGPAGSRAYSALELRAHAAGRSNLAALLRAEAVRRRFEMEATSRLAEHRRRVELRTRDRILRSNPAWHLVKNNHEEDIKLRLQSRRDEERMRREEFLHEMELMYGRVQQQPMLFERYYAPRAHASLVDSIQLSPRKQRRRSKSKSHYNTPSRSRKVSINDTAETIQGDVMDYLNGIDNDKYSDSEGLESLEGGK